MASFGETDRSTAAIAADPAPCSREPLAKLADESALVQSVQGPMLHKLAGLAGFRRRWDSYSKGHTPRGVGGVRWPRLSARPSCRYRVAHDAAALSLGEHDGGQNHHAPELGLGDAVPAVDGEVAAIQNGKDQREGWVWCGTETPGGMVVADQRQHGREGADGDADDVAGRGTDDRLGPVDIEADAANDERLAPVSAYVSALMPLAHARSLGGSLTADHQRTETEASA